MVMVELCTFGDTANSYLASERLALPSKAGSRRDQRRQGSDYRRLGGLLMYVCHMLLNETGREKHDDGTNLDG